MRRLMEIRLQNEAAIDHTVFTLSSSHEIYHGYLTFFLDTLGKPTVACGYAR
jgi:hypothetical protein